MNPHALPRRKAPRPDYAHLRLCRMCAIHHFWNTETDERVPRPRRTLWVLAEQACPMAQAMWIRVQ